MALISMISRSSTGSRITLSDPVTGASRTLTDAHIGFGIVRSMLAGGEDDFAAYLPVIDDAFDAVVKTAGDGDIERLSTHVSFDGRVLRWEGEAVDNALGRAIVRIHADGGDYRPLVNFMERLADNPDPVSRRGAWRWLEANDFTITPEGKIVGYKGVRVDDDNRSIHSGVETVRVAGREHIGYIPNPLGATVEMDRDLIDNSRDALCSRGLHVGTWSYASNFGRNGRVLTVLVDPSDIVAVPRDANGHKMRVARYEVIAVCEKKIAEPVWSKD